MSKVTVCGTIGTSLLSFWLACEADTTSDYLERRVPNSCDSSISSANCNLDP